MGRQNRKKTGFTLLELMIGAAILVVALVGLIAVFTYCFTLNETSRNLTIAINGCQEKLEEIRNLRDTGNPRPAGHYSDNITSFLVAHKVSIDIFDNGNDPDKISKSDLFWISISVSWEQRGKRIIGEDTNLNGNLDTGEDTQVVNGILDSPAQIITLMTKKP